MERKLDVYKRYRDDFGVDFTQTERDKILNNYDQTGVEVLVGKKMFRQKQDIAAVRIQSWCRQWFNIIQQIRYQAAVKIQRKWRMLRNTVLFDPKTIEKVGNRAAIMIQKYIRGKLVRNSVMMELSNRLIEENLSYFDELKRKIQVDAYEKIADAWKAKLF